MKSLFEQHAVEDHALRLARVKAQAASQGLNGNSRTQRRTEHYEHVDVGDAHSLGEPINREQYRWTPRVWLCIAELGEGKNRLGSRSARGPEIKHGPTVFFDAPREGAYESIGQGPDGWEEDDHACRVREPDLPLNCIDEVGGAPTRELEPDVS